MKTRSSKSKLVEKRWEKQQNKKNKNISNLFKANKYRKTKGNLRKNQAKMEPKTKDACTQTTVETNTTASQTQTEMKEVFVQTSTKTKSASTQTNVFLANPRSPPISPSGRPRKPLENLRLEKNGELRDYTNNELFYSFDELPIFPIGSGQILPPPLHITHGVATRSISILEFLIDKRIFSEFLLQNHIERDPRTKTFRAGNDLTKLLQAEVQKKSLSKLIEQQEFQQAAALWHKLIEGINWWFTQSGFHLFADPMETADLVEKGAELLFRMFKVLRNNLENIAANGCINLMMREKATSAAKKARPFPKLHYLRHHCAEFIRKNGWWGIASEQAIESYHAVFNRLELRFRNNRDRKLQIERMTRHQFLLNYLHDHGFDD
ncbi:hypothetical protein ACQ4LE_000721 [Meloidogyne hapla]